MQNAIILHGRSYLHKDYISCENSESNRHWIPWLQWEMIKSGILTQTPEMPNPYFDAIDYDDWVKTFKQFNVDENSILIGHSCGGGFLLKYLSNHPDIKIKHLVLIAPWIDVEQEHPTFFKNFEPSKNIANQCDRIDLIHSTDDKEKIALSAEKIRKIFGNKIIYHEFNNKRHFTESTMGTKFPELLEIIKQG